MTIWINPGVEPTSAGRPGTVGLTSVTVDSNSVFAASRFSNEISGYGYGAGVERSHSRRYKPGKYAQAMADHSVLIENVQNYHRKELAIWEKFVRDNPGVPEFQNDYAGTCYYLATCYGLGEEALVWSDRAIETWEKLARTYPAVSTYRVELARAYEQRGCIWEENGHIEKANESYRRERALREDLSREQAQKIRPSIVGK